MDRIINAPIKKLSLTQIVKDEVALYQASSDISQFYALLDDDHQRYGIIVVENDRELDMSVWVFMMARVVDEWIIIEEDTSLNKHLFETLMARGIPRDQIILAYRGETLPEFVSETE